VSNATILIDLHYLPSLEYFSCLFPYHTIRLEAQESYQKQTYRNRCYVLTSQQVDRLTVPVCQGSSRLPYKIMQIDYGQPWENLHWRALCTAYSKAPYFKYFAEYFRVVFLRRYTYLFDLNLALLNTCLQLLQLDKKIEISEYYAKELAGHVVDARYSIQPKTRLDQSNYYRPVQYQQVFGTVFHPNLSIIDLLFCEGDNAYTILQQATIKPPSKKQTLHIP
jgi:WbqC-like protein family